MDEGNWRGKNQNKTIFSPENQFTRDFSRPVWNYDVFGHNNSSRSVSESLLKTQLIKI